MDYHQNLQDFIHKNDIKAEHLQLDAPCHTAEDAAKAVNSSVQQIVKSICMVDEESRLLVAIVNGDVRVSTTRVGQALYTPKPRLATPEEALSITGYPIGGIPSFGFEATFLVDPKVAELDTVYTGGGTPNSLVKIKVDDLLKVNNALVARVRK